MTTLQDLLIYKKIAGGGGGGEAVLITKNITANGTYNASSDNADGYSQVTVNVPDRASQLVDQTISGEIVIPEGVTTIRPSLFSGCTQLTSVQMPSTLTRIQEYGFANTTSLKSIDLSNIQSLNQYSFLSSGIETVDASNISYLANGVFQNCASLKTVKIGAISPIPTSTFKNCSNMEYFDFTLFGVVGSTVGTSLGNVDAFNNTNNAPMIFATQEIMQVYAAATNWSTYASRMTYVGA